MGLSWQQGPLGRGRGRPVPGPDPLPERLLFAEPLRRRMRVRFGGDWIADSEDVVLLHEPGRYPVAYFPGRHRPGVLQPTDARHHAPDLGTTAWLHRPGRRPSKPSGPHGGSRTCPPTRAMLRDRVAFAWHPMDAFYEEDERIVGHAADLYHRIDIRRTVRHLVVRDGDRVVADTAAPLRPLRVRFRAALVRAARRRRPDPR